MRPQGSNADEWHLFLCHYADNRATQPNGLTYLAVQIAEAIEARTERLEAELRRLRSRIEMEGGYPWPDDSIARDLAQIDKALSPETAGVREP